MGGRGLTWDRPPRREGSSLCSGCVSGRLSFYSGDKVTVTDRNLTVEIAEEAGWTLCVRRQIWLRPGREMRRKPVLRGTMRARDAHLQAYWLIGEKDPADQRGIPRSRGCARGRPIAAGRRRKDICAGRPGRTWRAGNGKGRHWQSRRAVQ
eukprot:scaffold17443_cov38-Cyclotella_meneghiniana.AAC.8